MRLAKWDNLKFVLIYFVVLGHFNNILKCDSGFLDGLQTFIYAFHMPAFFFISGLFSKKTVDGRRYGRMIPYLVLFLFMKTFRFLVYSIVDGSVRGFDLFSEGGVPWFALTLFFCYLATVPLSMLPRRYALAAAVGLGMMAGYDRNLGDFLTGMRFFTFYPFFLFGYCIPAERITEWTKKTAVKAASAAVLACWLICSFVCQERLWGFLGFWKGKFSYKEMGMLPYGGLYRGIYYVFAMVLIFCLIAVVPSVRTPAAVWGRRTVQVFAVHFPILYVLMNVFHMREHLISLTPKYGVLVPFLALALTVVLSLGIWQPFFDWLMCAGKKQKQAGC